MSKLLSNHQNYLTRSFIAGALFLATSGSAAAAESTNFSPQEGIAARAAVCASRGLPQTPIRCEKALSTIKPQNMRPSDSIAIIDGICMFRHSKHHVSFYNACKADPILLAKFGLTSQQALAQAPPQSTAGADCAKGATVAVGGAIAVHIIAGIMDVFGCMGACTLAAGHLTVPAVAVTAAGGCATNVIAGKIGKDNTNYPRPAAPK